MMINAQILFCNKHRTDRVTSIFIFLEKIHNFLMSIIWGVIKFISFGRLKRISKKNADFFAMRYDSWKRISTK